MGVEGNGSGVVRGSWRRGPPNWEAGFRSFSTSFPLNSPADAKGKKLRIAPVEMIRWIMEAQGWNPVVMPVTEVYLAIQQGTVTGQENPVDTIFSQRFYEVAKHITLSFDSDPLVSFVYVIWSFGFDN